MIRKTAFLTGVAGLILTTAPAFAQDATTPSPQTPPPASTPAPSGTLSLQPGSDVKGSDGTVLGKLEGARRNAAGEQELTVRGADGQLRAVPLGGLKQDGTGVSVDFTSTEYQAAPAIASEPSSSTPAPAETSPEASAPTQPQ